MKSQAYTNGTTTIALAYSPANQAYIVWREDNGYQALVRIHNQDWDALADYDERVSFHKQITGSV